MMQWIGAVGCVGRLESRGLYYRVAPESFKEALCR